MSKEAWNSLSSICGYFAVLGSITVIGFFCLRGCEETERSWQTVGAACVQSGGSWVTNGPVGYQCIGGKP
jgi:hypothetical protein